ncbi:testis-expressed protein 12 isoform X2 [Pseudophryne corroboree]|uniref:testis-expressed protein 12 isoform X2 n=1 Tax=Pseudophryne corroboree TaxID=495146 RepID=UPI00308183CB
MHCPVIMANIALKYESKCLKRKKEMEILDSEIIQCSSPTSQPSAPSDSSPVGDIEAIMKDLSKELNLLFCNYAKTLSERAAVDVLYVHEFDEILKDARSLEMQLKQKMESLKNNLTMIANNLSF